MTVHARHRRRYPATVAPRSRVVRIAWRVALVTFLAVLSPLVAVIALGAMLNSASASSSVPLNYSTTGCAFFDRCDVDTSRVDILP